MAVIDGSLGLACLETTIPALKIARLERQGVSQSKVPGWRFQNMIQLCAGTLKTKARKSCCTGRGSQDPSAKCDVCVTSADTVGHHLQTCLKGHSIRTDRHDQVLHLLVDRLKRKG